jgi:hypothetical protein
MRKKGYLRGASKIKLKSANKKRAVTVRRVIFLKLLKASIADLITLFFSSLHNSEGGGDGDNGGVVLTPSTFYHFRGTKFI